MRLSSVVRLAFAALAVSLAAAPAAAQDEFVYADIPWGSDSRATTAALAARDFLPSTEHTPEEGDLTYEDDEGAIAYATFRGGALVGVQLIFPSTDDEIEALFSTLVQDAIRTLGDPDETIERVVVWYRGETSFFIMAGESDGGVPYVTMQYTGPGYDEELERRRSAAENSLR